MTGRVGTGWDAVIGDDRWQSSEVLWVEGGTEHSWRRVDELAAGVEAAVRAAPGTVVVLVRAASRLGAFAGQLGAWRAGRVVAVDDGLGPAELARIRPDLVLSVPVDGPPEVVEVAAGGLPADRLPPEVVAVNFTSGSTGARKAVAVTRGNLAALFGCRGLDVPVEGRLVAANFASPAYDGWWFDTWKTAAVGGVVVCLPKVTDDVFAWPELVERYGVHRVLLPAAVVATLVQSLPECVEDIPWVFSGGERFRVATVQQARDAGLATRFVNLYGPTEATFATHGHVLPADPAELAEIPIGTPLDGCAQRLEQRDNGTELVVSGPVVCLGYLDHGRVVDRFPTEGGHAVYRTGDLVRPDADGALVFVARLDSQVKVNGVRVDTAALETEVTALPGAADCRVVQDGADTVAFVRVGGPGTSPTEVEPVVKRFSPAIAVELLDGFPVKDGGKVDARALMELYRTRTRTGEHV